MPKRKRSIFSYLIAYGLPDDYNWHANKRGEDARRPSVLHPLRSSTLRKVTIGARRAAQQGS
jgi:hypothetical protein